MTAILPPVAIVPMITPIIMPGLLAHHFDPIWFGGAATIATIAKMCAIACRTQCHPSILELPVV